MKYCNYLCGCASSQKFISLLLLKHHMRWVEINVIYQCYSPICHLFGVVSPVRDLAYMYAVVEGIMGIYLCL